MSKYEHMTYDERVMWAATLFMNELVDHGSIGVKSAAASIIDKVSEEAFYRGSQQERLRWEAQEEKARQKRCANNPNPGHELWCDCDNCMYLRQDMPELWGENDGDES